jgi:death-on-curing protein
MAIRFLSIRRIKQIHQDQIDRYGGSMGIRDEAILESAVAQAEAGLGDDYLHAFPFEMAAAYLFHLVQGHAFIDGNKRVGAMAAFVFLRLNGLVLAATEAAFEQIVLQVSQGLLDKQGIAAFFAQHVRKPS